jgi:hypothetical protein
MTISDCLGASDAGRFSHTLDATLDAPAKRDELLAVVHTATRYLRAIDLRIPVASDTIDHAAVTCDAALAA